MDNKADKPDMGRRHFFTNLAKRALAEVKEGYEEGLAAQNRKAAAKPKGP